MEDDDESAAAVAAAQAVSLAAKGCDNPDGASLETIQGRAQKNCTARDSASAREAYLSHYSTRTPRLYGHASRVFCFLGGGRRNLYRTREARGECTFSLSLAGNNPCVGLNHSPS